MSALPHSSRVALASKLVDPETKESSPSNGDAELGQRSAPVATTFSSGKPSPLIEARLSSLKILAQSLVREIQSLEEQGAADTPEALNLQTEVRLFEAELIRSALVRTEGRQRRAARLLGMKVTTLNAKIKRYKIG